MQSKPTIPTRPAARAASAHLPAARAAASAAAGTVLTALALLLLALLGACTPREDGEEVRVRGILTEESADCQALRSEDGELYALTGEVGDVRSGDLVEVSGALGDTADCDGGIVVRVSNLEVVDGPSSNGTAGDAYEENGMPVGEPAPDGQLLLEGELTDEGVECPAFRSDDGELYTLTGDLGDSTTGDRVRIVGTPVEVSTCQQGTTIEIVEIGLVEENGAATQI